MSQVIEIMAEMLEWNSKREVVGWLIKFTTRYLNN